MKKRLFFKVVGYSLSTVLSLAFTAFVVFFIYKYTINSYDYGKNLGRELTVQKESKEVTITLKEDATIKDVAKALEENGVIANALVFEIEAMLKKADKGFKAGTYTLNTSMDENQIDAVFHASTQKSTDKKITIVEGYRLVDIAKYLESKEIVKAEDFLKACEEEKFEYEFLKDVPKSKYYLEGFLFPDTYFVKEKTTPREIIEKMLDRFDEVYDDSDVLRAQELGLTTYQVITLASIVEKEVPIKTERETFAKIIYNRLDKKMPLNMPSTIVYALNKRRDMLTATDLETDSLYNTYKHKGLPQGPICNPGKACIDAVLYPEETDYLYFVVKDEKTSEHFFTNNEAEYFKAKEEFKQKY